MEVERRLHSPVAANPLEDPLSDVRRSMSQSSDVGNPPATNPLSDPPSGVRRSMSQSSNGSNPSPVIPGSDLPADVNRSRSRSEKLRRKTIETGETFDGEVLNDDEAGVNICSKKSETVYLQI